jgi:hypothetical protein
VGERKKEERERERSRRAPADLVVMGGGENVVVKREREVTSARAQWPYCTQMICHNLHKIDAYTLNLSHIMNTNPSPPSPSG